MWSAVVPAGRYIARSPHVSWRQWHWSVRVSTSLDVSIVMTSHFWIPPQNGLQFSPAMCAAEDWVRTTISGLFLFAGHWTLGRLIFFTMMFTSSASNGDVRPTSITPWKCEKKINDNSHYKTTNMYQSSRFTEDLLNALRPRQMAAIFQTTFSNSFSWMKMF